MKSDITRVTHQPAKHYRKVVQQQGRVQMDADWNEQMDILAHREVTTIGDVVGLCGAPYHPPDEFANFKIALVAPENPRLKNDFMIAAGRIVDGILCENEADLRASKQPSLPHYGRLLTIPGGEEEGLLSRVPAGGVYLAYIVVREAHVTALEDPHIADPALGGLDTATRTQTLWQVKLLKVGEGDEEVNCLSDRLHPWIALVNPTRGKLSARARPGDTSDDPCNTPSKGGYTRLQNQLYRVEIHDGGRLGRATFKWSRDNGTVVTSLKAIDNNKLIVGGLGRDEALGFAGGQWVEVTDDTHEQQGRPGTLVKLSKAEVTEKEGELVPTLTIDNTTATGTLNPSEFPVNPKVRRWDIKDCALKVEQPTANDGWIELEDGVQVRFERERGGAYETGDYWLIPARTVTADVEWPKKADKPQAQTPHGPQYHYCRLALLKADGDGVFSGDKVSDCRPLFPAVTELTSLFYVSGDGQEATPGPTPPGARVALGRELVVGVANGRWPVKGAKVQFKLVPGTGNGRLVDTDLSGVVIAGDTGLASCQWELDATTPSQQVEATLLDAAGNSVHVPIRFTAHLSRASDVAFDPSHCAHLAGKTTVQDAIDGLCELCADEAPQEAIRIREVSIGDSPLRNDRVVEAGRLAEGLAVQCSHPLHKETVEKRPVCFVTLELPFPLWGPDLELFDRGLIGYQPLILDATVTVHGQVIEWKANARTVGWLKDHVFPALEQLELDRRLLAHLTLRGNFIVSARQRGRLYLDGDAFGLPRTSRTRAEARYTYTDLSLPSGDGVRGGDFRMWFWLTAEAPD